MATIFDVAAAAGVSHQTVSRVLNGDASVRAHNRERVEAAIKVLEYRPSAAARALASRRTRTIGLVVAGLPLYGPSSTVHGFDVAARAAGWDVAIAAFESRDVRGGRRIVEGLLAQDVQALVVVAPPPELLHLLATTDFRIPVVTAGRSEQPGVSAVAIDQREGAALAVRHLAALGHRSVLHVAGPSPWLDAQEREAGWREESARLGMATPEPLRGDWTAASGYRLAPGVVRSGSDAVFCANDQMALGLLRGFEELDVSVPSRIRVVGFDDIPEAAYLIPSLTTVRQDFDALGRAVVDRLTTLLGDVEAAPDTQLLPVRLVVRGSTRPT